MHFYIHFQQIHNIPHLSPKKLKLEDLHLSQLRPGAVLEALPLTRYDWCVLLFGTVVIFTASVIQERSQRTIREILDEKCLALRWAVLLAGIFAVVLMGVYGPGVQASEFVYMQF